MEGIGSSVHHCHKIYPSWQSPHPALSFSILPLQMAYLPRWWSKVQCCKREGSDLPASAQLSTLPEHALWLFFSSHYQQNARSPGSFSPKDWAVNVASFGFMTLQRGSLSFSLYRKRCLGANVASGGGSYTSRCF